MDEHFSTSIDKGFSQKINHSIHANVSQCTGINTHFLNTGILMENQSFRQRQL